MLDAASSQKPSKSKDGASMIRLVWVKDEKTRGRIEGRTGSIFSFYVNAAANGACWSRRQRLSSCRRRSHSRHFTKLAEPERNFKYTAIPENGPVKSKKLDKDIHISYVNVFISAML